MKMFECYIDLTDINDSMELESGQEIARYEKDGFVVTLEVHGDVRVIYDDTSYRSVHSMPEELIEMFHNGTAGTNPDVYIDMNNWFEVFFWERKDNILVWTGLSDVVDYEKSSPEELESLLKDCYTDYLEDFFNMMKERELIKKLKNGKE